MAYRKWVALLLLAFIVGVAMIFHLTITFPAQAKTGYSLVKDVFLMGGINYENSSLDDTQPKSSSVPDEVTQQQDEQITLPHFIANFAYFIAATNQPKNYQEENHNNSSTITTSVTIPTTTLIGNDTNDRSISAISNQQQTLRKLSELPLQYPDTQFKNTTELLQLGEQFMSQSKEPLIILLWTKLFRREDWALGAELGQKPFKNLGCPVSNCFVTKDRQLQNKAAAVLINFRDDFNYNDRPGYRPPNQHWIYFLWESPEHTYDWTWWGNKAAKPALQNFKGFFNWTMTYRLDSDIPFLYGRFTRKLKSGESKAASIDRLATKTKSVIWIQSNCNTRSHRAEFVQALRRHIDVDVIGPCAPPSSNLTEGICRKPNVFQPITKECMEYISSTYKYYLATENSLCRDYVTEKFFRGASLDLVPIVFNGANMSQFGPPHSYIDAKNFDSPKKLAHFLKETGNNSEKYNSYFWWKQFYKAENFWDNDTFTRSFCDLCAKVTRARLEPEKHAKVYENIEDWWMVQGNCYEGKTAF